MEEKRRFLRFDAPINLEFKVYSEEGDYSRGTMVNFSRQGLSFIAPEAELSPSQEIDLRFKIPNKDVIVTCHGEVVWKKEEEGKRRIGIRVKEIDPYAKGEMLEYAYNNWVLQMRKSNYQNN